MFWCPPKVFASLIILLNTTDTAFLSPQQNAGQGSALLLIRKHLLISILLGQGPVLHKQLQKKNEEEDWKRKSINGSGRGLNKHVVGAYFRMKMGNINLFFILLSVLVIQALAAPVDLEPEPEPTGMNVDGIDLESFRDSVEAEPIQVVARESEVESPTAEDESDELEEQMLSDPDVIVLTSNQEKRSDLEDEDDSELDVSSRGLKLPPREAKQKPMPIGKPTKRPEHGVEGRSVEQLQDDLEDEDDSELDVSTRSLKKPLSGKKPKNPTTTPKPEHQVDGRSVEQVQLEDDDDGLASSEEEVSPLEERSIPSQGEQQLVLKPGSLWSQVKAAANAYNIPPCPTFEDFYRHKAETHASMKAEKRFKGDIRILLEHVGDSFHGVTKCMRRLIADLKLAVGISKMNRKTKKQIKLQQKLSQKTVKIVTAADIVAAKKKKAKAVSAADIAAKKKVVSAADAVADSKPQILSPGDAGVAALDNQNPAPEGLTEFDVPTKIGVADILPGAPLAAPQPEPGVDVAAPANAAASPSDPLPEAAENPVPIT
ncbi:unnamed protein product [Orchesella dallaii]|uniref:Uncharacterized protein n=1 Tax=Orchesella dallaii TaxID=48710 RepID=A0ABP1PWL5_9HEXA